MLCAMVASLTSMHLVLGGASISRLCQCPGAVFDRKVQITSSIPGEVGSCPDDSWTAQHTTARVMEHRLPDFSTKVGVTVFKHFHSLTGCIPLQHL